MKKILCAIIAAILSMSVLCSCGNSSSSATSVKPGESQAEQSVGSDTDQNASQSTTVAVVQTAANGSVIAPTAGNGNGNGSGSGNIVSTTKKGSSTPDKTTTTKRPTVPTTTKPLPANVDYSAKEYDVNQLGSSLRVVGRASRADNKVSSQFTCGGVEFNLICKGDVTIKMKWARNIGMVAVVINGDENNVKNYTVSASTETLAIAKNLAAGRYTFKIIKLNEVNCNTFNFLGVKFNGILGDKATQRKIKIEAYGDSITCGAWNKLNQHSTSGYSQGEYEDGYSTYVAFAARTLGADLSVIAQSGWGLVYSPYGSGYDAAIPKIWDQVLPSTNPSLKWDFSSYIPDVVVVNLGTNDKNSGVPSTSEMTNAVKNFSKQLRSKYPKCAILWVTGMMGEYGSYTASMKSTISLLKDDKIKFITLPSNMDAGDWHPSIAGHKAAGDVLTQEIEKILGL